MTQQTTADEFKDVAADATNTATEFGKQTAERVVESVKEASAKAASLAADTQKTLGANVEDFSKRLQGVSSFNQQTLEAFGKSSEIAAKAFEGIGREVAAYTKTSFEERVAAAQDLATAKTLPELFEKQTAFARQCLRRLGAAGVQVERNLYRCRQGHRRADRPAVFGGRRRGEGLSRLDWYLA